MPLTGSFCVKSHSPKLKRFPPSVARVVTFPDVEMVESWRDKKVTTAAFVKRNDFIISPSLHVYDFHV